MLSRDSQKSRRKFMAVVGAGMTALSGCSSGGDGSQSTDTETSVETTSQPTDTAKLTEHNETTSEETETDGPVEDQEWQYEERWTQNMEDKGLSWIEIQDPRNVDFPSWALENGEPAGNGIGGVGTYEELVANILEYEQDSEAEAQGYLLGWSDPEPYTGSGEFNGEVRDMVHYSSLGNNSRWDPNFVESKYEKDAIVEFLDQNVSGYVDHSEDIDEEMLEYASE